MNIRPNEDYYYWCCDWCDTENRVLWAKVQEGMYCGACHKRADAEVQLPDVQELQLRPGIC